MTLKSLEEFDKEIAAKRKRLEKDHAVAHALPTNGKILTWIGEGGFESDGNTRKPDVERTIEIVPHIVHSPFRGCEHVAFRAPYSTHGDGGEHVSSQHRTVFGRKYLRAVLDAFEPYLIDTVAVRGTYASYVPESFDWGNDKDYKDAIEVSRGLFEVEASMGTGQNHYTTARLSFYTRIESVGPVKVSFDLEGRGSQFMTYKLMPTPRYKTREPRENSRPIAWNVPTGTGAVHLWRRADGGGEGYSYSCLWLYDSRDALETALGL